MNDRHGNGNVSGRDFNNRYLSAVYSWFTLILQRFRFRFRFRCRGDDCIVASGYVVVIIMNLYFKTLRPS